MKIRYDFAPQGKVLHRYFADRSPFSAIMGPLGSGKTIQTCQKMFALMCEQPPNADRVRPSRWLAVRNTYSELMTTTIKDWLSLFGDLGNFSKGGKEPPTHRIFARLADKTFVDTELIFLAADREDHVAKFRGIQCTGLWLNEMKELPKAIVDIADLRHGRYPTMLQGGVECGWHGIIGDTNAPDEDHWYFHLAEKEKPNGYAFFRQPGALRWDGAEWVINPAAENLANLPREYYERGKLGKREDWIKVMLANEYGFAIDGKPIYPEFSSSLHVKPVEYLKGVTLYRGWDFGLTPACVFLQITPAGKVAVIDEVTSDESGIDTFADAVIAHTGQTYGRAGMDGLKIIDYGDPAGAQRAQTDLTSCYDILFGKKVMIQASDQAEVIRKESLRHTLTRLVSGQPMFAINPRCVRTIKGLRGGYCYKRLKVSGERYQDKPDKSIWSHPVEALEYITARIFGDSVRGLNATTKTPRAADKTTWKAA